MESLRAFTIPFCMMTLFYAGCGIETYPPNTAVQSTQSALSASDRFYYLRCNVTGWSLDAATYLVPVSADEAMQELEFQVKETWQLAGNTCTVTSTNLRGQYGSQVMHYGVRNAPLVAPGDAQLTASGAGNFQMIFPSLGRYRARLNAMNGAMSVAAIATKPERRYSVLVAVHEGVKTDLAAALGSDYHGDQTVEERTRQLFGKVDELFNDPNVFNVKFNYVPDKFTTFTGKSAVEQCKEFSGYDIKVTITSVPDSPKQDSTTSCGKKILLVRDNVLDLFSDDAALTLAHELGHWHMAYDLYGLDFAGYLAPPGIMHSPRDANRQWTELTKYIINGFLASPETFPYGAFASAYLPDTVRIRFANPDGSAAAGVPVKIWGAGWDRNLKLVRQATADGNGAVAFTKSDFIDPTNIEDPMRHVVYRAIFQPSGTDGFLRFSATVGLYDIQLAAFHGKNTYEISTKLHSVARGDVDDDGVVSVVDAMLVAQYAAGTVQNPDYYFFDAGDANCDGRVDAADVDPILQAFMLGAPLVCP